MRFQFQFPLLLALLKIVSAAPISHEEIAEKTAQGLRLLDIEEGADPVWRTEDERLELLRAGVHFFDVTETYEIEQEIAAKQSSQRGATIAVSYPPPSKMAQVNPLLSTISTANMQSYLSTLTSYNNRYYTSSTGSAASTWILNTVRNIAAGRSYITVNPFTHSWAQSSVIAKIAGTTSGPVTILGAHLDSINLNSPSSGRAPGADDDGTGTVNLIEIFRALVASGFRPTTPVEFHWYAAEEVGLLGSQAIATNYRNTGVQVKAFMELDMSGYFRPGTREVMAIQADYIDAGLNEFLKQLIDTYSRIPWTMDIPCGYACSDHASWYRAGFPGTFPYEAVTGNDNPSVHTSSDTTSVNGFSWSHSLEFAKIGFAFVYELAA
ncbi:hypothetical protein AX16_001705 [Volvariella volvacea WC 439]|nr:hypothetical protein AX16_001705 [Volvariella volvacea WC 439]